MPISDKYLILSGKSTSAGIQTLSMAAGSVSTAGPYSPFDLGYQISSMYGQSPYNSANLNPVTPQLGQSVKKFFFLVTCTNWMSGGTATSGVTIALQAALTSAATYNTVVQSGKILKSYLSIAAAWSLTPMLKVPIPEAMMMNRFIKGLFTTTGTNTHITMLTELTEY